MTIEYPDGLFNLDNVVECDIIVTLDSGCCEHVLDLLDAPGYQEVMRPSKGSIRGQNCFVGSGDRLPDEGEVEFASASSQRLPGR